MSLDLNKIEHDFEAEVGDVSGWVEDKYNDVFAKYFDSIPKIDTKNREELNKMSDETLERILAYLPLDMIEVSADLSDFKMDVEFLRLSIKKKEAEFISNSMAKTHAAKKELAALEVFDYKLLLSAYTAIIERVENQIAFSRELIMSCKKIWDSRRKVFEANPINEDVLGDYVRSEDI